MVVAVTVIVAVAAAVAFDVEADDDDDAMDTGIADDEDKNVGTNAAVGAPGAAAVAAVDSWVGSSASQRDQCATVSEFQYKANPCSWACLSKFNVCGCCCCACCCGPCAA